MHVIHALPAFGFREPFSTFSHLIGCGVFLVLSWRLLKRGRGDPVRIIGLLILIYTSIQTLILSSLYHAYWPGPERDLLLRIDVAGIFLLIAGSLTPVHCILFTGGWRWFPLLLAWSVAFLGASVKLFLHQGSPGIIGMFVFLMFGWGTSMTAIEIWRRYGWNCVRYAIYAGLSYTAGAIILMQHRPTLIAGVIGPHELWHLAVLAGLGLHWRFIFQITEQNPRPMGLTIRLPGFALPHRLLRPLLYILMVHFSSTGRRKRRKLRMLNAVE